RSHLRPVRHTGPTRVQREGSARSGVGQAPLPADEKDMPAAPPGRLPLPRWTRLALMVLAAACVAFAVSTIPGVRAHPGHASLWDTWVYDGISLGAVAVCFGRAF